MVSAPALRRPGTLFWAGVAVLSVLGILVLPFSFPPRLPTFSSSYTIGFNNRVAAVVTALISFAVTLFLWRRGACGASAETSSEPAMPRRWLLWCALAAVAYTALLGWRVAQADTLFADIGYFIVQIPRGLRDHAVLYRDFEFPYGPVLFYWPAFFVKVLGAAGIGSAAANLVALAAMQVAGYGVLFFVLEKLPLARRTKGIALAVLTCGTLTPLLGLNYTMFRFALPFAALLWIAERRGLSQQALLFGVGEIVMLLVSADVALAFAAGVILYAAFLAATRRPASLLLALAPILGFLVFAAFEGKDYFRELSTMSAGCFNIPVEPLPHLCIFLIAAVALAPVAVAGIVRSGDTSAAGIVAMYGASLGMIPSALGHCDGLHVFFSGLGCTLLSLLALRGHRGVWPRVWLAAFALLAIYSSAGQASLFASSISQAVLHGPQDQNEIDIPRLEAMTAGRKILAPLELPQTARRALLRDDRYQDQFFYEMVSVWDAESERRKVAEMHHAAFLLFPARETQETYLPNNSAFHRIFRLGYAYKPAQPPYVFGQLMEDELQQHWVPVSAFGHWILYAPR